MRLAAPWTWVWSSQTASELDPASRLEPLLVPSSPSVWRLEHWFVWARCSSLQTAKAALPSVHCSLPLSASKMESAPDGLATPLQLAAKKPRASEKALMRQPPVMPVPLLAQHYSGLRRKPRGPRRCPVRHCFRAALQRPRSPAAVQRFLPPPQPVSLQRNPLPAETQTFHHHCGRSDCRRRLRQDPQEYQARSSPQSYHRAEHPRPAPSGQSPGSQPC